ncbi:MAG: 1,4-dihydroxy-2-naphthoate octaprenyltransferase [Calditrichia bacterium]|nr:1,4-dihydroxy-2-naphthoate octaprenyltransferase [Calditrichia bacterium]
MTEMKQENQQPGWFKKWLVATRPFALPASTMPVIFGTVLAITIGGASFNWILFIAAFLGMITIHTGSNLLNDAFDFKKGVDTRVNPVSGGVVRGWITTKQALWAGLLFVFVGALLGVYIALNVGMVIFWLGIIGVIFGIFYTAGPLPFKFNALGDLSVFLNFGVLGALGAWTVQTGTLSWTPAIWAIPMSILVIGILHANNWRDIKSDKAVGVNTVASLLGDKKSGTYYSFLLLAPFFITLLLILIPRLTNFGAKMPLSFLITFLAIPLSFNLIKKGKNRINAQNPMDFLALDGATAQQNLLFGVLCIAAIGLNVLIAIFLG